MSVSVSPKNPCLDVHELPGVAVPVVAEEHGPGLAEVALRQSLARINFSYRRTDRGLNFLPEKNICKIILPRIWSMVCIELYSHAGAR